MDAEAEAILRELAKAVAACTAPTHNEVNRLMGIVDRARAWVATHDKPAGTITVDGQPVQYTGHSPPSCAQCGSTVREPVAACGLRGYRCAVCGWAVLPTRKKDPPTG